MCINIYLKVFADCILLFFHISSQQKQLMGERSLSQLTVLGCSPSLQGSWSRKYLKSRAKREQMHACLVHSFFSTFVQSRSQIQGIVPPTIGWVFNQHNQGNSSQMCQPDLDGPSLRLFQVILKWFKWTIKTITLGKQLIVKQGNFHEGFRCYLISVHFG